jgi:hypothetical protein
MSTTNHTPPCCPQFDPAPWQDKRFEWQNKRFIKDKVMTIFNMPINFGSVITKMTAKANKEGAVTADYLCLSDHTSSWNMDVYLAVEKEIPGAQNVIISGSFFSHVYEGHFKDMGKWMADFEKLVADKGMQMKKMYAWYTTCPKCAKAYGKNYVVLIAQI